MRAPFVVRSLFAGALVIVLTGVLAPRAVAAGEYTVTNVGTLVGTGDGQFDELINHETASINAEGRVAASGYNADQSWMVAFTSLDGDVKRIGKEKANSRARDINDAGDVVGAVADLGGDIFNEGRAAVWRDGELIELPTLGGERGNAEAINEAGDIVGGSDADAENRFSQPVLWRGEEIIQLEIPDADGGYADDINEGGMVVGGTFPDTDGSRSNVPFVWTENEASHLPLRDNLTFGRALALNDDGTIVSYSAGESGYYATRWIELENELLPTLIEGGQGFATDINNEGQIVGTQALTEEGMAGPWTVVLWDGDEVVDLSTVIPADSGFVLNGAASINDAGQIFAMGTQEGDTSVQALLLSPVDESAARIGVAAARVLVAALRVWAA